MRVVLLCHAATRATRDAAFAEAEELSEAASASTADMAGSLPRVDSVRMGPTPCCAAAAQALRVEATVDEELAGGDFGSWTGRALDEVLAAEPEALQHWLADPTARPHGGESLAALVTRVGGWLDTLEERTGGPRAVLALADPTAVRAAITHAVGAGPGSIWRFDVSPRYRAVLVGAANRWSLRELAGQR